MAEVAATKERRRQRKQVHPLQNHVSFDRDVVECWRSIGKSEDLNTDTGIAKFLISLYTQRAACAKAEDGVQSCVKCVVCHRPLTLYCLTCKLSASQIPTPQSPPLQGALRTSVRRKRRAPLPPEKDSSRAFSLSQASCVTLSSQHVPSMQVFLSEETGKSDRFHAEFRHEPVLGACMGTGLVEKSPDPVTEEIGNDGPLSDIKGEDDDVESEPSAGTADPDGSDRCVTKLEGSDSRSRTDTAGQKLVAAGSLVQASGIYSNISTGKHAEPARNVEAEEKEHASSPPQQPQAKMQKRRRPRGAENPSRSRRKCQGKGESSRTDANQSSASAVTLPDTPDPRLQALHSTKDAVDGDDVDVDQGSEPLSSCDRCPFTTKYKKNLKRHMDTKHRPPEAVHVPSLYVCEHCGAVFQSARGLSCHVRGKHERVFRLTCSVCRKGFNDGASYRGHLAKHDQSREIPCERCGKRFRFASNLARHVRCLHQAQRVRYRCEVGGCLAQFSTKTAKKDHINTVHIGLVHACPVCSLTFKWRTALHRHRQKAGHYGSVAADQTAEADAQL